MKADEFGKLLLRIAIAGIILFHGVFKVMNGVEWIKGPLGTLGLPGFLAYGTYLAEVVAPVLLVIGYQVRVAALVIAVDMVMAIILALQPRLFTIKEAGGGWAVELEALLLLASLALAFLGGGRYALSRRAAVGRPPT